MRGCESIKSYQGPGFQKETCRCRLQTDSYSKESIFGVFFNLGRFSYRSCLSYYFGLIIPRHPGVSAIQADMQGSKIEEFQEGQTREEKNCFISWPQNPIYKFSLISEVLIFSVNHHQLEHQSEEREKKICSNDHLDQKEQFLKCQEP